MTQPTEPADSEKIGTLGFALYLALQGLVQCSRTHELGDTNQIVTCSHIATHSRAAGDKVEFACVSCMLWTSKDPKDPQTFKPLPHSRPVQHFGYVDQLARQLLGPGSEELQAERMSKIWAELIVVASALLDALPPCSGNHSSAGCARCAFSKTPEALTRLDAALKKYTGVTARGGNA